MIKASISDGGNGLSAKIIKPSGPLVANALAVYPLPIDADIFERRSVPFFSPTFGVGMNVNGAASGAIFERMHDGEDTSLWTPSSLGGSWDFSSSAEAQEGSQSIDATSTTNNDEALLKAPSGIDLSIYTNLELGVFLDSWPLSGTKDVQVRARASGVNIGNFVSLAPYIDTASFGAWQNAIIPKADMSLTSQNIDELVIKTVDIGGGQAPDYYLDEIQWIGTAAGAGPTVFSVNVNPGEWMYIHRIQISIAGPLSSSANDTVQLSWNKILGVDKLTNGMNLRQTSSGSPLTLVIKNLMDFLKLPGARITSQGTDGVDTFVTIDIIRDTPIVLKADEGHFVEMQINDDLSSLLHFNIVLDTKVAKVRSL